MQPSWKTSVVLVAIIVLLSLSIIVPVIATNARNGMKLSSLVMSGTFVLKATQIHGVNARLQLLPDATHPIFSFDSSTIQGLQILAPATSGGTLEITASGTTTATNVAIKTTLGYELATATQSFVNKADLVTLALGGTVSSLDMTNVNLVVDTYIKQGSTDLPGLQIAFTSSSTAMPAASNLSLANVVATVRPPTPTVTVTATTTVTTTAPVTTTATATKTATPGSTATSTATVTTSAKAKSAQKPTATPTPKAAATSASTPKAASVPTPTPTPSLFGKLFK